MAVYSAALVLSIAAAYTTPATSAVTSWRSIGVGRRLQSDVIRRHRSTVAWGAGRTSVTSITSTVVPPPRCRIDAMRRLLALAQLAPSLRRGGSVVVVEPASEAHTTGRGWLRALVLIVASTTWPRFGRVAPAAITAAATITIIIVVRCGRRHGNSPA